MCDGKVTLIRVYLAVGNEACEVNTKEAVPSLTECDDWLLEDATVASL